MVPWTTSGGYRVDKWIWEWTGKQPGTVLDGCGKCGWSYAAVGEMGRVITWWLANVVAVSNWRVYGLLLLQETAAAFRASKEPRIVIAHNNGLALS